MTPRWHKVGPMYEPSHMSARKSAVRLPAGGWGSDVDVGVRRDGGRVRDEGQNSRLRGPWEQARRGGRERADQDGGGQGGLEARGLLGPGGEGGGGDRGDTRELIPMLMHEYAKGGLLKHFGSEHDWFRAEGRSGNGVAIRTGQSLLGNGFA
jgi:hypothetical protein